MITNRDAQAAVLLREDESRLVHQMVRDFSTCEPFDVALRKQLNWIGLYLRVWLEAKQCFHFFTNPNIHRIHYMIVGEDEKSVPASFKEEQLRVVVAADQTIQEVIQGDLQALCTLISVSVKRCLFIPFSQHDFPFGHFILTFEKNIPSTFICEKVRGSLNVLQGCLKDLLYNHYPITSYTYLPSFQSQQTVEAAILFCDVRNSTAMHEIARMATDERYIEMIVILLQSLLEYASRTISVPSIGRLHRFMGDGFLATFGEHLIADSPTKQRAACALALLAARLLFEGFAELWKKAQKHVLVESYLGMYNEDLDLRLGVGVNYGRVRFGLFGTAMDYPNGGQTPRGFYDFTAVGDHMNFAQRLCSVASQPVSSTPIVYRSNKLQRDRLTAPIIASRTVTYWSLDSLRSNEEDDPLVDYRTDFEHKGKSHPMPGYELWPGSINMHQLLSYLENIHNNRFHDAMQEEVRASSINQRPALRQVIRQLNEQLDKLHSNCSP